MGVRTGNPPWHNEPVEDSPIDRTSLENIELAIDESAPIDSPEFIGTPTVPTPPPTSNDSTIPTTGWVTSKIPGGSTIPSQVITRAAYDALATPDAGTLYVIQESEGAMGAMQSQADFQYPGTYSAFAGTWLVDYKSARIMRPVFRQNISLGSITLNPKSAAYVPASSLIILTGRDASNIDSVFFFSTSSLSIVATVAMPSTGSSWPVFGSGAIASDGFVYFAPLRSVSGGAITGVLKVNPSTHAVTVDNFSSTYVADSYGHACVGGDGKVYFLPGLCTAAGGVTFSGSHYAYMDPGTHTLTTSTIPPIGLPFSQTYLTSVDAIAAPTGVYMLEGSGHAIYKFSTATATLLQDLSLLDSGISCFSGFSTATSGKIVALASATDHFSNQTVPALIRLKTSDESIAILKMPELQDQLSYFNPCSTLCDSFGNISTYQVNPQISGSDVPPGYPAKFSGVLVGAHVRVALGATPLRGYP